MKHLLDVNALLALLVTEHSHHSQIARWVAALARRNEADFLTCSITELGFIRIVSHANTYGRSIQEARTQLAQAKAGSSIRFHWIDDSLSGDTLPAWVKKSSEVTDGHLVELAKANKASLATLDAGIPGVFLIPA